MRSKQWEPNNENCQTESGFYSTNIMELKEKLKMI